jgi:hypothetical protein
VAKLAAMHCRRIDAMVGEVLPDGYRFEIHPNGVGHAVLGKSTWAVLALTRPVESRRC